MFHVKPTIKGVIFDFNGTLFWDHDINYKTWSDIFYKIRPAGSNKEYKDFDKTGLISNDKLAIGIYRFFGLKDPAAKQVEEISVSKETAYQQMVRDMKKDKLIEGVETLFEYLRNHHIPYCIASMAPKMNMEFYLDYLHLDKWFTYDNIVYDNGKYPDKNSQIIEAAKRMGVDPKDCLLFEDSSNNINLAIKELHLDKIIFVNTRRLNNNSQEILQEIQDYTELNYNIFNN